jgi:hypothetical protein
MQRAVSKQPEPQQNQSRGKFTESYNPRIKRRETTTTQTVSNTTPELPQLGQKQNHQNSREEKLQVDPVQV